MPELIINGRFLCQRATGVQRVSREFTIALDQLMFDGALPDLRARIIAPAGADFSSLHLRRIETEHLAGGQGHLWEQVSLARRVGRARLLCLGNTAPVFSLLSGRSVSVMLHDQSYRLFPADYGIAYRIAHSIMGGPILRRSRPLLTVSEAEKANIEQTHPRTRMSIVVAPNGSWIEDRAVAHVDRATTVEPGLGLCVGGNSDRKNIDGILATAAAMAAKGHPFVFVGSPTQRSDAFLEALPFGVRERITFKGFVSNSELEALYRAANYLLYPSFYEASGLPPSEAMTFGCPVIVSDLPVMHERCGDAALYCNPHDHASIFAAATRLVDDPQLAATLSQRGIERAQDFTWRKQALTIVKSLGLS